MTKTELYNNLKRLEELSNEIRNIQTDIVSAMSNGCETLDNAIDAMISVAEGEMNANECYAEFKENDDLDFFDGEDVILDTTVRRY